MFSGATLSDPVTTPCSLLSLADDNSDAHLVSDVYPRFKFSNSQTDGRPVTFPKPLTQRKWLDRDDAPTAPKKSLNYMKKLFADAQLDLGKQMFRAGIDDQDLIERISRLDQEIKVRQASGASLDALQVERDALYRQLADAALAYDAPLPGAQTEFDRALETLHTLQKVAVQSKEDVRTFRNSRANPHGDQLNAMTV